MRHLQLLALMICLLGSLFIGARAMSTDDSPIDIQIDGNLTVLGETVAGKINATVLESSIIKSKGVAELGGLEVNGAVSANLVAVSSVVADGVTVNDDLRVKDHLFAGSGHFTNLESSIIKSSGVAELGGLEVKGALSAGFITTNGSVVAGRVAANLVEADAFHSTGISEFGGLRVSDSIDVGARVNAPSLKSTWLVAESATLQSIESPVIRTVDLGTNDLNVTKKLTASEAVITRLGAKTLNVKNGLALGEFASVHDNNNSAAIGSYSNVIAPNSVAVGPENTIIAENAVALGRGMFTAEENSLVMGMDFEAIHIAGLDPEVLANQQVRALRYQRRNLQTNIARFTSYLKDERYSRWTSLLKDYLSVYEDNLANVTDELEARVEELTGEAAGAKVGIGISKPEQSIHISGAMKLEPMKQPPSHPSLGVMYMNSTNALCVYMEDGWEIVAGDGECVSSSRVYRRGGSRSRSGVGSRR